jgi:hypothetical protein
LAIVASSVARIRNKKLEGSRKRLSQVRGHKRTKEKNRRARKRGGGRKAQRDRVKKERKTRLERRRMEDGGWRMEDGGWRKRVVEQSGVGVAWATTLPAYWIC